MQLQVDYTPGTCILLALFCLTVPIQWIGAFLLAGVIHELCHILAVIVLGGRIHSLKIGVRGACLEASPMSAGRELICILAGSAGSLSLLILAKWLPRTALCGLVQGLFNLLPVYPLDGGRAVLCILGMFLPWDKAGSLCRRISVTVLSLAVFLSVLCGMGLKLGVYFPAAALILFLKCTDGKISCKEGDMGVQ